MSEATTDPDATLPGASGFTRPDAIPERPPARSAAVVVTKTARKPSVGLSAAHSQAETKLEPALDPLLGTVVAGRYQILELLAVGGQGKVYKARHKGLDRLVCLKTLRPRAASDPTVISRFEREARAASRLTSPHCIQVYDFGEHQGDLYLSMEFVEGLDLRALLARDHPLGERRACLLMAQVLSALSDAHAQNVVHRDLKPENVMVGEKRGADFVKVLDFGIAKVLEDDAPALTLAGRICGTPLYMSPEQARGEPVDARTDLYAAGVILYQLLTGILPFYSENTVEILTRHVNEQPLAPTRAAPEAGISPEAEALVLRALSKSPSGRPPTAEAFRRELLAIAERAPQLPDARRAPPQVVRPVPAPSEPPPTGPREAPILPKEPQQDPMPETEDAPSFAPRVPVRLVLASVLVVLVVLGLVALG